MLPNINIIPSAMADAPVGAAAQSAVEICCGDVQTTSLVSPVCNEPPLTKPPDDCVTKEDVRAELDRIDQALLNLFAERHRYVTRMAEIKTDPHEAHDPVRIAAILDKQRRAPRNSVSTRIRPN